MNRKCMIVGLMLAALVGTAVGVRQLTAKDDAAKADEPKKLVDEVVAKLKAEDYKAMIEAVRETQVKFLSDEEAKQFQDATPNPLIAASMMRDQLKKVPGKSTGEVEVVGKQVLGDSYAQYLLLQRFDRGGVIWKVILYRHPKGWAITDVGYDANVLPYLKAVNP